MLLAICYCHFIFYGVSVGSGGSARSPTSISFTSKSIEDVSVAGRAFIAVACDVRG
jgi:hypothetical protein